MAVVLGSSYINREGVPHSNTILYFYFLTMRSPSDISFIMMQAVTYDIEVEADPKNIYRTDFDIHDYMHLQMV